VVSYQAKIGGMGPSNDPYKHAVHSREQVRAKSWQEMVHGDFIITLSQCKFKVVWINDPRGIVPCLGGRLVKLHEWPEAFTEAFADGHDKGMIWCYVL